MKKHHDIRDLHFDGDRIVMTVDGERKEFKVKDVSPMLEKASERERNTFEISPSGYGIHWPLIDEDIAIDGLLGIVHTGGTKRKSA